MNLGFSGEMIFLAVLGLLLFGPKKLPEIARGVGRFVAELKRATNEFQGQLTREIGDVDIAGPVKSLNSLVDRIRAANVAPSNDQAMMALVGPAPGKERFSEAKFVDNISRISGFLASNPEAGRAANAEERCTTEAVAVETHSPSAPAVENVSDSSSAT